MTSTSHLATRSHSSGDMSSHTGAREVTDVPLLSMDFSTTGTIPLQDEKELFLAEKRRKQRDMKRISRLRKKGQVESMRARVKALEAQYRVLLDQKQLSACEHQHVSIKKEENRNQQEEKYHDLFHSYAHRAREIAFLRFQNAEFKDKLLQFDRFNTTLDGLLRDFQLPLRPASFLAMNPLIVQPFSFNYCQQLINKCLEKIYASPQWKGTRASQSQDDAPLFGWKDQRYIHKTKLAFHFNKSIPHVSRHVLESKTWDILTTLQGMKQIQPSILTLEILQVINKDVLVIQRRVLHAPLDRIVYSVFFVFRVHTEENNGINTTILACKSLDHSDLMDQEKHTSYVQAFQWFIFRDQEYSSSYTTESHATSIIPQQPFQYSSQAKERNFMNDDDKENVFVFTNANVSIKIPVTQSPNKPWVSRGANATFAGCMDNGDLPYVRFFLVEIAACLIRWEIAVTNNAYLHDPFPNY